jgi:hypothetical protein
MKVWTIEGFDGHWPVGTSVIVTADTVELAIVLLEKELERIGLRQTIKPEQLIPYSTTTRNVRILNDGNY